MLSNMTEFRRFQYARRSCHQPIVLISYDSQVSAVYVGHRNGPHTLSFPAMSSLSFETWRREFV